MPAGDPSPPSNVMILTSLPDLPPRPEREGNAEFRRNYYARWGKEHVLLCGRSRSAEYPAVTHPLSIKMAWNGSETYRLKNRDVAVSDDTYLILNAGTRYGSFLKGERPVSSLSIFVRPDVAGRFSTAAASSLAHALEEPDRSGSAFAFSEHLRRGGDGVTQQMRRIHGAVLGGERDEQWLEEQVLVLLDAMLRAERQSAGEASSLAATKPATRIELTRRLRLGADFMRSNYTEPLTVASIAAVACLSPFHFVRHFRALHGVAPHAFLVALRVAAARRLICSGLADPTTISIRAGFGSLSSMRRALARSDAGQAAGARSA